MSRPRLLDLFCGAGGAGMGYHRAGFDVVGVDIKPQPRYPFEFHQGDALEWPLDGFDAIHASPPCLAFTTLSAPGHRETHENLVPQTRARLVSSGIPWVIENVIPAPVHGLVLCGASFGLDAIRHRVFESNLLLMGPPCSHRRGGNRDGTYVSFRRGVYPDGHRPPRQGRVAYRRAIGVDWMTSGEDQQAIPPAFTEHIGRQLLRAIEAAA